MDGHEARFYAPIVEDTPTDEPYLEDSARRFIQILHQQAEASTGLTGDELAVVKDDLDQLLLNTLAGRAVQKMIENGELDESQLNSDIVQADIAEGHLSERKLMSVAMLLGYELGLGSMGYSPEIAKRLDPGLVWSYAPLSRTDTPSAEPDDRMQNAIEGVRAKVLAYLQGEEPGVRPNEIPLTKAANANGYLQIVAGIESPHIREQLGARVKGGMVRIISELRRRYQTVDLSEVGREKAGSREEFERLQNLQDVIIASEHIPWGEITFPYAAPEEGSELEGEAARPLPIDEIYPDVAAQTDFEAVDTIVSRGQKAVYLAAVDMKQQDTLLAYNGFPVAGLPPGPHDRQSLARFYGVRVAAITGRTKGAVKLLRHPIAAQWVENALTSEPTICTNQTFSGDRLRTSRAVACKNRTTEAADSDSASHQALPEWTAHLKSLKSWMAAGISFDHPSRNTLVYDSAYRALRDGIWSAVDTLRVSASDVRSTPYPFIFNELDKYLNNLLAAEMIEDFWNSEATLLLQAETHGETQPVNADRLGQLISRLLAACMREEDQVILEMPGSLEVRCGYLGVSACRGGLILKGNAGDYIGAHMRGNAMITVHGTAGDYAGFAARGSSRLTLKGDAGRHAGKKAGDFSTITLEGQAQLPVGADLLGQARVLMKARNVEIKSRLYDPGKEQALDLPSRELTASAAQLLGFNEAAAYLGLTSSQLQYYTEQLGHSGRAALPAKQLLKLKQRWPELGAS
jgi:hypothetical protein